MVPAPAGPVAPGPGGPRESAGRRSQPAHRCAHRHGEAIRHDAGCEPLPREGRPARGRGHGGGGHLHARGRDAGGPAGPGAAARAEGMMSLPRLVPLGVLALVMPDLALAEGPTRKTLAECIAIALAQQPTLKAASASVEAARERVWESTAVYLPQVGASYNATRRHASAGSLTGSSFGGARAATFDFYSTGVALSQVLFDFGQNLSLIHAAQRSAESTAADAATQHDTVVLDVEQAYFGLLASYRLRDVADETVADNQKHLDLAQGRFDVGLAPKVDVTPLQENWNFGAAVNLSLFNGGLTTAQVGEAKANLQNLQANEELTRQNITLDVRQATLNLRQAVESIRVADKGLQLARENLEIAEGRYGTGVGNIIELTDAQTSLTSAEASRVQAVVNYRTALASLERATAHPFSAE